MMENELLKIGITQGDTNGVGWEVILKTLADPRIVELCTPIIYGSPKAAGYYRNTLREVENVPLNTISDAAHARAGKDGKNVDQRSNQGKRLLWFIVLK